MKKKVITNYIVKIEKKIYLYIKKPKKHMSLEIREIIVNDTTELINEGKRRGKCKINIHIQLEKKMIRYEKMWEIVMVALLN